ncbi:hypothetical protein LY56_01959 [Roseinatronobacter thiooxidans]|uniref:YgjP-like metallopeptidase domain-containing protein n=1 Tax=Roseinatronobacter thiooxidans TaxID=121821 RepID=A0A2W7QV82_9RHOB|nr:SprT family zinc-dependent metalloprotease [Roseinatronobacter thiooxidans]PZX42265.1 hypothetical protein LY56_01959 [Roseinatronobacter thiooxidans]
MRVENGIATLHGTPEISVVLRRSGQARRLSLRVSGLDGRVTLTMPNTLHLREALEFLQERESWLRAAMTRLPEPCPVAIGADILLRGEILRITEGTGARIAVKGGQLLVPPDPSGTRTALRVETYLKASARAALVDASERYAAALGRPFSAITLRDTRSRWGSCTAQGRLMFSWRLIMAPPLVLDYVAAHEVAHLKHMDHSRVFWNCVARLMPDYQTHRDWLSNNGAVLHTYSFTSRPEADRG